MVVSWWIGESRDEYGKKEDELEKYYRIKLLPKVQLLIAEALAKERAEYIWGTRLRVLQVL
jgi:hypothetical protein